MKYKRMLVNKHIQSVAKGKGISVKQCRREMEYAIKVASEKPTPLFIKMFGDRTPDLEEFLYALIVTIKKEGKGYDA